jgi:hypothetical protein
MAIKMSEYGKQLEAYNFYTRNLSNLTRQSNSLPPELQALLGELHGKFSQYDMSQHKPASVTIEGEMLDENQLLEWVKSASEDHRWQVVFEENPRDANHQWLEDDFGVKLTQDKVKYIVLYRTEDISIRYIGPGHVDKYQDNIYLIRFYVVPGHVYYIFTEDAGSMETHELIANEDVLDVLQLDLY